MKYKETNKGYYICTKINLEDEIYQDINSQFNIKEKKIILIKRLIWLINQGYKYICNDGRYDKDLKTYMIEHLGAYKELPKIDIDTHIGYYYIDNINREEIYDLCPEFIENKKYREWSFRNFNTPEDIFMIKLFNGGNYNKLKNKYNIEPQNIVYDLKEIFKNMVQGLKK